MVHRHRKANLHCNPVSSISGDWKEFGAAQAYVQPQSSHGSHSGLQQNVPYMQQNASLAPQHKPHMYGTPQTASPGQWQQMHAPMPLAAQHTGSTLAQLPAHQQA
jgi:hypothetical protein